MRSGFRSTESHVVVRSIYAGNGRVITPGNIIGPDDFVRGRRKRWFRKRFIERLTHPRALAALDSEEVTEREEVVSKPAPKAEKLPSGNTQDVIASVDLTQDDIDVIASIKVPKATISHDGGPWYTVTFADGATEKVKGKKAAKALVNG